MKSSKKKEKITKDGLIEIKFRASIFCLDEIKYFLEEQATKGYMLVKNIGSRYYFKKTEPCNVKYTLEVFNKKTKYKNIEAKNRDEFITRCKELGWNYTCSDRNVYIFYTDDNNLEPINICSREKVKEIHKGNISQMFLAPVLAMILCLLPSLSVYLFDMGGYAVDIFIDLIASNVFTIYMFFSLLLMSLIKMILFMYPNRKSKKDDKQVKYLSYKVEMIINIVITANIYIAMIFFMNKIFNNIVASLLVVLVVCIWLFLGYLLMRLLVLILDRNNRAKIMITILAMIIFSLLYVVATFKGIMIGVSNYDKIFADNNDTISYYDKDNVKRTLELKNDELPLVIDDLYIQRADYYSNRECDERSSFFGRIAEYKEELYDDKYELTENFLSYEVLDTKFEFIKKSYIKKICNDELCNGYKKDESEAKKWKAKEFYKEKDNDDSYHVIIVFEDKVFYFKYNYDEYLKNKNDKIDIVYDKLLKK